MRLNNRAIVILQNYLFSKRKEIKLATKWRKIILGQEVEKLSLEKVQYGRYEMLEAKRNQFLCCDNNDNRNIANVRFHGRKYSEIIKTIFESINVCVFFDFSPSIY